MDASSVLAVACMSMGTGAMLVYFHMNRREREHADERHKAELGISPLGKTGGKVVSTGEWLVNVAVPGVLAGIVLGLGVWLVVALPLSALGVIP